jgi:hypothetical protein
MTESMGNMRVNHCVRTENMLSCHRSLPNNDKKRFRIFDNLLSIVYNG